MIERTREKFSPRKSLDIVESSILRTIIPEKSTFDIESSLRDSFDHHRDGDEPQLPYIPQRQALYFDETVDVYIILQIPHNDKDALKSYLDRLTIMTEAQVNNSSPDNREFPPVHEIIFTRSIQGSEDHPILMQMSDVRDKSFAQGPTVIVWKISVFMVRPRLRLLNPSVSISARAILRNLEHTELDNTYLSTTVPSAINMLEAFSNDPSITGVKPQLSALRVSQVTPTIQAAIESSRPLQSISRQSIPIFPLINAKIKYSRSSKVMNNLGVLASVEIDITSSADFPITLTHVGLSLKGGHVRDLSKNFGLSLPTVTLPLENVTFMYFLDPEDLDTKSPVRDIFISISATADLSISCQPQIAMNWSSSLSFTPPVNPGFGTPRSSIKRAHRPAQISIDSNADHKTSSTYHSVNRPEASATESYQGQPAPICGITISFIQPPSSSIYPEVPFAWTVCIANRSDRPRKLALMVSPQCRSLDACITRSSSIPQLDQRDQNIAEAVLDEKIMYATQKAFVRHIAEIICLSTDHVIGPLAPMACHEVELEFMALKSGNLTIEAVRIVDLDSQELIDIRNLPTVHVSPITDSSKSGVSSETRS